MKPLELPWPRAELSPNTQAHWTVKAKAKAQYGRTCQSLAAAAKFGTFGRQHVELRLDFYPPDHRQYDLDNMLARMKSGIDGICRAIGIDDVQIRKIIVRIDRETTRGIVAATITEIKESADGINENL